MKNAVLLFIVIVVCLVSDTASRAISAATSSPLVAVLPGNIPGPFSLQAGDTMIRRLNQSRTLTFEERVRYQHAVEEVYWRHRIWPKERTDAKPALDAVVSRAQLEEKVTEYERSTEALGDHWHRPITAEQLQAEIDRMAEHTKQPEVLQELFDALGNDPFVIAECLARPVLAQRLLTNSYAYDKKIHGELRGRAEADLQAHNSIEQMKQLSGKYSQIEFVKNDSSEEVSKPASDHAVKLNASEWDQNARELAATLNKSSAVTDYENLPVGKLSSLQEDANGYYATAVIEKRKDRLKVATVAWQKKPLGSWLATMNNQVPAAMTAASANYTVPNISEGTCIDNTWRATDGLPDARAGHTAVWTGSEMIIWGGQNNGSVFNTGARYNPSTDSWTTTAGDNAPDARVGHTAVWTGAEMIVWGGYHSGPRKSGGRYNPGTDSWTATSTTNAPSGRSGHTAVWTGAEMIVWGGHSNENSNYLNSGGRYNPRTDVWTATTTVNAPDRREGHTAVWTGSEMIVWGGGSCCPTYFNTGGSYNPTTNSWTATSTTNAPTARNGHTAVWTGSEMIIWGGGDNTGGRYNPSADTWTPTSTANAPSGQSGHTAVWTGSEMIIWRGLDVIGGRYNPSTDSWIATSSTNAPTARGLDTAVWTGLEMIVWGGDADGFIVLNSGGRYNPSTDSWTPTAPANVPSAREDHTAVWTGSEMIIWGGGDNTGGKYNPSTDSWLATTTTNAPTGRAGPTAVWTGSEMIVWGGYTDNDYVNTGGRYNPVTDSWIPTTTNNTPTARYRHTAVWTGSEMVIWGGNDGNSSLNTGGRYNPRTDSWAATTTTNAPSARYWHTAIWTGSEMIVWGGIPNTVLNTGGRYNPTTDSWIPTSTINAPAPRAGHTAVWTGFEMIVWLGGGGKYNPSTDTWTPISTTNAPYGQLLTTASVWTGSEMIVWGGNGDCAFNMCPTNTGGRYNPATDTWRDTAVMNAPAARAFHTAVWTGSEMIIWGGYDYLDDFNTGGRYCAQPPSIVARLGNVSTRAFVLAGNNVMIGGFIVQGTQTKRLIIRAIGPELSRYGVPNPLFNPTLELHDGTGALIGSNDNWTTTIIGGIITSNQVAEIRDSGHAPRDGRESAIIADLPPGNYTAIVRGVDNMTGVALVEAYDLNPETNSILSNISTRSFVQTGDNVMIGGFIVHGTHSKKIIIRAIGPELSAPPFNIPDAMINPMLELHDGSGALIAANDNWQVTIVGGIITSTQYQDIVDSGHAPGDVRESAIIAELPAGNYTAIVRGVNNTTGVALVEAYDLGQ